MKCPTCKSESNGVIDSRPRGDDEIRRRRKCDVCGRRWTTVEASEIILDRLHRHVRELKEKVRVVLNDFERTLDGADGAPPQFPHIDSPCVNSDEPISIDRTWLDHRQPTTGALSVSVGSSSATAIGGAA